MSGNEVSLSPDDILNRVNNLALEKMASEGIDIKGMVSMMKILSTNANTAKARDIEEETLGVTKEMSRAMLQQIHAGIRQQRKIGPSADSMFSKSDTPTGIAPTGRDLPKVEFVDGETSDKFEIFDAVKFLEETKIYDEEVKEE